MYFGVTVTGPRRYGIWIPWWALGYSMTDKALVTGMTIPFAMKGALPSKFSHPILLLLCIALFRFSQY